MRIQTEVGAVHIFSAMMDDCIQSSLNIKRKEAQFPKGVVAIYGSDGLQELLVTEVYGFL